MSELTNSIWLDGKVVSRDDFSIAPDDEMLLYGRGVFETTRTFDGILGFGVAIWNGFASRRALSAWKFMKANFRVNARLPTGWADRMSLFV